MNKFYVAAIALAVFFLGVVSGRVVQAHFDRGNIKISLATPITPRSPVLYEEMCKKNDGNYEDYAIKHHEKECSVFQRQVGEVYWQSADGGAIVFPDKPVPMIEISSYSTINGKLLACPVGSEMKSEMQGLPNGSQTQWTTFCARGNQSNGK